MAQGKNKSEIFSLQIALTHNPLINEVQAQVDISYERLVQARSGFIMPRIDASGAVRFRPMMPTAAAVIVGASVIKTRAM